MEKEIEYLKTQLIRIQNYPSIFNSKKINYDQCYLANQILNEHEKHQIFSQQIKDEFQRIDSLVYEANTIANEMQGRVVYKTILHIPVSYLKPNERVCISYRILI
jgi:transcription initiation factor IIF auxiliary subunit